MSTIAQDLSKRIEGRVADAGDRDYAVTVSIDNGRITREPKVVVVPINDADVSETIKYATSNQLAITAKSGGHSASGYCLNDGGIVVDLRELNSMSFNAKNFGLRMGAGSRWGDVYDYMEMGGSGRIPVGGGCPGVGVGGFLLGGGYSFLSRSYGLGSDNVRRLTLVTADGEVTSLSSESKTKAEQDLFWGCLGGGGGNFGIVTQFEVETHATPTESLLVGQILFPLYRLPEVLEFYNAWVETLPDEMAIYGYIGYQPDPRSNKTPLLSVRFTPIFNGKFADGYAVLQGLTDQGPVSVELYDMTLPQWEEFIGSVTLVRGRSAYIRSTVLGPGGLTPKVAQIMMKYMARCPSLGTFMVWTHAGGQIAKISGATSPFPHRNARFVPEIKAIWDSARPEEMRRNVEWAYDFFEELGDDSIGAYLNYIDPLLSNWTRQYYGGSYERLLDIKRACDPRNVFAFQQSIGSKFEPSRARPLDLSPLHRS